VTGRLAFLALAAAAWFAAAPPASTQDQGNLADACIFIDIGDLAEAPYEQEMILLRITGFYGVPVTRQELIQPDLPGFSWMQLGRDRWFDGEFENRQMRALERTMALFPEAAGTFEIAFFVHRLFLMDINGRRFSQDVVSNPLALEVRPRPEGVGWWLPARQVRLTEKWDRDPAKLEFGQTAVREVTLIAAGASPEMMPPAPKLKAQGLNVFPHPEQRVRELTREGPVSSVTWRWTVTPLRPEPVVLQEVRIPWFDTQARQMREVVLPAYAVAQATGTPPAAMPERAWARWLAARAEGAGVAGGLTLGLVFLAWGRRLRPREELVRLLRRRPSAAAMAEIRRAARAGDAEAFRRGAAGLMRLEPDKAPGIRAAIDAVDRHIFAGGLRPPASELSRIAGQVKAILRERSLPEESALRSAVPGARADLRAR